MVVVRLASSAGKGGGGLIALSSVKVSFLGSEGMKLLARLCIFCAAGLWFLKKKGVEEEEGVRRK